MVHAPTKQGRPNPLWSLGASCQLADVQSVLPLLGFRPKIRIGSGGELNGGDGSARAFPDQVDLPAINGRCHALTTHPVEPPLVDALCMQASSGIIQKAYDLTEVS